MIVSTGNFLSKCFDIPSIETLNELLSLTLQKFNIKHWAYLSLPNNTKNYSDYRPICYTNYPKKWVEFYFENRFQTIDPILLSFQSAQEPYLWNCFLKELSLSAQQKKFFKQASDFQLHEGITFPIRFSDRTNSAILTLVPEDNPLECYRFFSANRDDIKIIAHTYHSLIKQFHEHQPRQDFNLLTPREQECLAWVIQGKSDYEIGIILGNLSKATVTSMIGNAKQKLDCYSRTSAAFKALQHNYIPPVMPE